MNMKTKGLFSNSRFYSQIFRLVVPIIIQNLLSAAVNSADVVMLNYVGQSSIWPYRLHPIMQAFSLWSSTGWAPAQRY